MPITIMEDRKDATGYLVEAMTSLSLAEREHIAPRDAKQLFISFCRTPGAQRVLRRFKEDLETTSTCNPESGTFRANKEQLTRLITNVTGDVAAAQVLKDEVQAMALGKIQATRMKIRARVDLLDNTLRGNPAEGVESPRERRERLYRKLTKVSRLLPGFGPGYVSLFQGPTSPSTHQTLTLVNSRAAELALKLSCLMGTTTSKESPSSEIPTTGGEMGPIYVNFRNSPSSTFQAHHMDLIKHIFRQGKEYADVLMKRFAKMTHLVCGTIAPFPWWPELLRIAARGLMLVVIEKRMAHAGIRGIQGIGIDGQVIPCEIYQHIHLILDGDQQTTGSQYIGNSRNLSYQRLVGLFVEMATEGQKRSGKLAPYSYMLTILDKLAKARAIDWIDN